MKFAEAALKDMNCRICGSDDTYWISTVMINDEEGYEVYACKVCKGHNEIGIKVMTGLIGHDLDGT